MTGAARARGRVALATRLVRPAGGLLGPVLTIVVAVVLALALLAEAWTRFLWFDSLGFASVLGREAAAQAGLFVVAGGTAAAFVLTSLLVPAWTRPLVPVADGPDLVLQPGEEPAWPPDLGGSPRQRRPFGLLGPQRAEPVARLSVVLAPLVVALAVGTAAATQWRRYLLWFHRRPFGVVDPLTGRDVGFFVFELPWWQLVTDLLLMVLALTTVTAAVAHYAHGGLRLGPGARSTPAATAHLSVLLTLLAGLQAWRYWLDRWVVAARDTSDVPGLAYAVEHAVLPGQSILAGAALVVAVLLVVPVRTGSWRLPAVGASCLAVCALVVGSVQPAIVRGVSAGDRSSRLTAVARAAAATRAAYGLEGLRTVRPSRPAAGSPSAPTTGGSAAPLLDPATVPLLVPPAGPFRVRTPVSVGRFDVGGRPADVAVGLRTPDLDGVDGGRTWANEHLVYTHASGVVGTRVDAVGSDGAALGVPSGAGGLGIGDARSYYAPGLPDFSVVGGTSPTRELGADGQPHRYDGSGGVPLSNPARRLAHAVALSDPTLLTSTEVTSDVRLITHRDPQDRVSRVAPWLRVDSQPYLVVVRGRLTWVVDGYTTSASYPGAAATTLDGGSTVPDGPVTYLRDAVRATVDAVDGSVHLYAWDESDPLLSAWRAAFPGVVEPASAAPEQLVRNARYPADLFRVQQTLVARFHQRDASAVDAGPRWRPAAASSEPGGRSSADAGGTTSAAPSTTTGASSAEGVSDGGRLEPALGAVRLAGDRSSSLALVATLTSADSRTSTGLLVGDAGPVDPGRPARGAGRLRLVLPSRPDEPSPARVLDEMRRSPARGPDGSSLRDLLAGRGARSAGPVLTLPDEHGLTHVLPVWIGEAGGRSRRLRAVAVARDGRIAWAGGTGAALARLGAGADSARTSLARARSALDALDEAVRLGDRVALDRARSRLRSALDTLGSVDDQPPRTGRPAQDTPPRAPDARSSAGAG